MHGDWCALVSGGAGAGVDAHEGSVLGGDPPDPGGAVSGAGGPAGQWRLPAPTQSPFKVVSQQ